MCVEKLPRHVCENEHRRVPLLARFLLPSLFPSALNWALCEETYLRSHAPQPSLEVRRGVGAVTFAPTSNSFI